MNKFETCDEPQGIWPSDIRLASNTRKDEYLFDSNRAGGQFRISRQAYLNLINHLRTKGSRVEPELKARLATKLIELRESGVLNPLVDTSMVDWLSEQSRSIPVSGRIEKLLEFLARTTKRIGDVIDLSDVTIMERAFAWSESSDWRELEFLLNHLIQTTRIERVSASGWFKVTVEGFDVHQKRKPEHDPSQVFVALWFNNETNALWEALELAIRNSGYAPIRIDNQHFWGSIDEEIITQIKQSKFLVADLTHGMEGARGSVYFEAGYAMGLGKAIVLTVHEDFLNDERPGKVHFDLQHHTILTWSEKNMQEFKMQLQDRIKRLFGTGPIETTA